MNIFLNKILDWCFPNNIYCIACDNLIDATRTYSLCDRCIREIRWNTGKTCLKCGKALDDEFKSDLCYDCQMSDHVFRKGCSCVTYEGWAKRLVQNMKYKDRSFIAEKISEIMFHRVEEIKSSLLIPVPMNIIKKNKRGYNQAELIAEAFSKRIGVPCNCNLLQRKTNTTAMSSLGRLERKQNLVDEIFINSGGLDKIKDKDILLIDDVYTTGSTANACAKALLTGGASSVDLLVFASGDNLKMIDAERDDA